LEEKNILTPNILLPLHEKCNPNFWKKKPKKSAILENRSNYLPN
jgi:hypothetical protein